jgi:hypothetical protein
LDQSRLEPGGAGPSAVGETLARAFVQARKGGMELPGSCGRFRRRSALGGITAYVTYTGE